MFKKTENKNVTEIECRVLVSTVILGKTFEPNTLIKGSEETLKPLVDNGELSDNKADVDYCKNELEVEVTNLEEVETNDSDESDENE